MSLVVNLVVMAAPSAHLLYQITNKSVNPGDEHAAACSPTQVGDRHRMQRSVQTCGGHKTAEHDATVCAAMSMVFCI